MAVICLGDPHYVSGSRTSSSATHPFSRLINLLLSSLTTVADRIIRDPLEIYPYGIKLPRCRGSNFQGRPACQLTTPALCSSYFSFQSELYVFYFYFHLLRPLGYQQLVRTRALNNQVDMALTIVTFFYH